MILTCPACGSDQVYLGYPDTAACGKCAHQWKRVLNRNHDTASCAPGGTVGAPGMCRVSTDASRLRPAVTGENGARSRQDARTGVLNVNEPAFIGPEKELMNQCRKAWQAAGRRVFRVGQFIAKGAGTDIACPDAFVRVPELGRAVYVGVELKTVRGRLSPEQADAEERGDIIVARNVAQAMRAVEAPE